MNHFFEGWVGLGDKLSYVEKIIGDDGNINGIQAMWMRFGSLWIRQEKNFVMATSTLS